MTNADPPGKPQGRKQLPDWRLPVALCCLASVLMLIPFFVFGTASGHDFEFHAASWLDVAYQWNQGVCYPRWTAWTNHGFGEPRYIFYPPLSWLLGAVLSLVLPGVAVPMVYIVLTQTLAGFCAFLLLRRLASRRGALLGALFYTVNPNALLMVYIRSDFAEQLACALYPLLLLAALQICELLDESYPRGRSVAVFALLYAGVWLCNAPAGVIASYAMALLIVLAAGRRRSWLILARGATGVTLGLGLAGFYLAPAAYEQRWVNISQALSSGLAPWQNFLFTAIDDVEHTWFNWIASICAVALTLIFLLAALISRRFASRSVAPGENKGAFTALLVVGTAATGLMLRWTVPLWDHLPKLRFVQFPWRWMSVVALVGVCFVAVVADQHRAWIGPVLALVLMIPLAWLLVRNTWWDQDEMPTLRDAITSGAGFEGTDEYDPLGDDHMELPKNAPLTKALPSDDVNGAAAPEVQVQVQKWTTKDKQVSVDSRGPARVALRVLNYPAWRVEVNGKQVQPDRLDDSAQMVIAVGPGNSEIRVRFRQTADRKIGGAVSFVSLLLALLMLWRWGSLRDLPHNGRPSRPAGRPRQVP